MAADNSQSILTVMLVVTLGVGVSSALIAWLVTRAVASVPAEDRQYKDVAPLGFRLVWWPVQWISYFINDFVSGKVRISLQNRLRKAGLDYCLSPSQYIAGRLIGGMMTAILGALVLNMLGQHRADGSGWAVSTYVQVMLVASLGGWAYPAIWLRDRLIARRRELMKNLPFFLDIITLCVEAGLNIQGAMNQAVLKGPKSTLREEFQRTLRDIRSGKSRALALRDMAQRINESAVTSFVSAVIQAESMGMNLGPILRAQADQRRSERFLRAEKLAMEAPVKMLFPLIAFIFPCTFIVLFFPIVMKFVHSGI